MKFDADDGCDPHIRSQIEVIEQGESYLLATTMNDYCRSQSPSSSKHLASSPGGHMRHIIDHYKALQLGVESGVIDYDVRSRGSQVQFDPQAALKALQDIKLWLIELDSEVLSTFVKLSTEVSIKQSLVQLVDTTIARELIFVGSHAVHHFAMIARLSQDENLPNQFGIAPATASAMRHLAH